MKSIVNGKMRSLNYLTSEINALYHEAALKLGLSDSAMMILYGICNSGDSCPLSDIYKLSGISKQTINSAVRKLEKEDIVFLEKNKGRSKTVFLTERGKEAAEKTVVRLIRVENSIFDSWDESDVDVYLEMNRRYAADLKNKLVEI